MAKLKRYYAIDGLRAFAAIGIVAMHVMVNTGFRLPELVSKVVGSLGVAVYLFMAVSAFSMCCGYYDQVISGKISIVDFYKRRFSKVLPFFAALCVIDVIISPSANSLFEAFADMTLCFGLLPNATMTVIGVGWFLGLVFVFYFMFPFFCFLIEDKKRAWFSFVIAVIYNLLCEVYFFNTNHVIEGFDFRTNILYSAPYFLLGEFFIYIKMPFQKLSSRPVISLLIGLFAYLMLAFTGENIWILLLMCWAFLTAAIQYGQQHCILNNKIVHNISSISLEIYLCHMAVFRVVEKTVIPLARSESPFMYVLVFVIVLLGAILFATVFHKAQCALHQRHAINNVGVD
ncbi:MAG: acyltransferase family protein [Collinsella sp.]